ncbi:putative thiazole-containing bacteriocin maturation protein [Brevibacillus sp. NRS-1366]|uniref:putative thiazole-containing bacteriocin maturation protein n=1 Tax=Brevibacillus sp. NRS-1366 TaxID=3233899 RepID=UPI003D1F9F33
MANVNPSMRLKVKRDTFFLPNSDGSVFFRNNVGTFQMEGEMIDQWVEQLLPMFNGEHTLQELTEDLPTEYQNQIKKIAESLFQNGFVHDVSKDRTHQLAPHIVDTYLSQMEFLDQFGGSGGYRFQTYRQEKALAVGSGPFFLALVSALLESGIPRFHYWITDDEHTNRKRLEDLIAFTRQKDPEVELTELSLTKCTREDWKEAITEFSAVLYVSDYGDREELLALHSLCLETGKVFVPAIFAYQKGIAGPLIHSSSEASFESAWRRLHRSSLCEDPQIHTFSFTAAAILANVVVFEWFKHVTDVSASEAQNKLYLLNLETLEGGWHTFLPHPMIDDQVRLEWVEASELLEQSLNAQKETDGLFSHFQTWTSTDVGIFHIWDEGDLKQLPLAQCQVQSVDPLSEGPAELLPAIVCAGFTHDDARREAGLLGAEMYVSRIVDTLMQKKAFDSNHVHASRIGNDETIGIGAGESVAEGLCRALFHYLSQVFADQQTTKVPKATRVKVTAVEDEQCQFYMRSLLTIGEKPHIGKGEDVCGFPVFWVGTSEGWYGSVGLYETQALRRALLHALMKSQNQASFQTMHTIIATSVELRESDRQITIPVFEAETETTVWDLAQEVLKQNHQRVLVLSAAVEPFLQEDLAGVFALFLREEEGN